MTGRFYDQSMTVVNILTFGHTKKSVFGPATMKLAPKVGPDGLSDEFKTVTCRFRNKVTSSDYRKTL